MLSALLNSIQSSLGSRGFLVGSVFPVLIFVIANGALSYRASQTVRTWLGKTEALSQQALLITALLAAIIVTSYVLSAASSVILEAFEGKRWPVSWFQGLLHRMQRARLRWLEANYRSCVLGLGDVEDGIEGDPNAAPAIPGWIDSLNFARRAGPKPANCSYPTTVFTRWFWGLGGHPDVGIKEMNKVRRKREAGRMIPGRELGAAVRKLIATLSSNSVDLNLAAGRELDHDCDYLIEAIYFSRDRYQAERIRLFKLRRFQFPVDLNATSERSAIVLSPTSMGNIGRTMRSYAQNHYGFDLDVLWTRLQNASQSSEKFYSTLQDAKVQLDFFVACTALASVTVVSWLMLELVFFRSVADFVLIGIVGPVLTIGAHCLSRRAYGVFADVMRSCVDLFRFRVLTDLHLPLPAGLEEEKTAWQNLANVMGYENPESASGKPISMTYKH